jgi:hypothetical protein
VRARERELTSLFFGDSEISGADIPEILSETKDTLV